MTDTVEPAVAEDPFGGGFEDRLSPERVAAALERASLDTPRQYDDRKTLAYVVNNQRDEIERLRKSQEGVDDVMAINDKAHRIIGELHDEIERLRVIEAASIKVKRVIGSLRFDRIARTT